MPSTDLVRYKHSAMKRCWCVTANNQALGVYMAVSALEAIGAAAERHGARVSSAADVHARVIPPGAVLVVRIVNDEEDARVWAEAWSLQDPHATIAKSSKEVSAQEAINTIAMWAERHGYAIITEADLVADDNV